MVKIGIITFYYKSVNYGGVLQAYALCRALNNMGHDAKQLCYEMGTTKSLKKQILLMLHNVKMTYINRNFHGRYKAFDTFRKSIPHTKQVYTAKNILKSVKDFDCFITGSDQVWNLDWYDPAYFLEFVRDKKKIAYAISLGKKFLSIDQISFIKARINDFTSISGRESDVSYILQDSKIKHVVDPTFLLTKKEWDEVCADRKVHTPYIYCHFIGDNKEERELVVAYAKQERLPIVCIPHPSRKNKHDIGFGDTQFINASPGDFISLVKNANIVFTDSFHCCAFSTIYGKEFVAFHRAGKSEMASRLDSLLMTLEARDHFCSDKEQYSVKYLSKLKPINYEKVSKNLEELRDASNAFLQKNII